jgi:hypothetical protein
MKLWAIYEIYCKKMEPILDLTLQIAFILQLILKTWEKCVFRLSFDILGSHVG